MSAGARTLLRRLALVLGGLVLAALAIEVLLRLQAAGPNPPFVVENGRVHVSPSRREFAPIDVAAIPDRLRIVYMGASTVVGVPYEPVLSPPRWLGMVLAERGVRAEVVMVAAPGMASTALLTLLPDVLALHPDAVVVDTGHNEYLAASELIPRSWWRDLRVVVLLEHWLGTPASADELLPTTGHDFDHAAVAETFRRNIHAMQALADAAGVPLLLCAPVSNLADFPPVLGANPSVPEDGDAAFARGQALLAAGDQTGALAAFERARDSDRWPHRANSALVAGLRAAARNVVPLDRVFAEQSERGIPGFDLFADHCHPTPAGQRLMALTVADALEDLKLYPLTDRRGRAPPLEAGLQTFQADARLLAQAQAQVGRTFTGFALMRGSPGPMAEVAERTLQAALPQAGARTGEVLGSMALLDLLYGRRAAARVHLEQCAAASPDAIARLQRLYDGYPWVRDVFAQGGVQLRRGELVTLPP